MLALLAGLFAWLRKVLSEEVLERAAESPPPTPPVAADPAPKPDPARSTANGGEATKAELYERAQQLGIEGRSRMSKAELQAAISRKG